MVVVAEDLLRIDGYVKVCLKTFMNANKPVVVDAQPGISGDLRGG